MFSSYKMNFQFLSFLALFVAVSGQADSNEGTFTPESFAQGLKRTEVDRHIDQFLEIARANDGTRASGTSGYKASVDYVQDAIAARCGSNIKVLVQNFTHLYEEKNEVSLIGPDSEPVRIVGLDWNTGTDGLLSAPLVHIPYARGGPGCYDDQWQNMDVSGKIALVQIMGCRDVHKVKLAQAHGAVAVIFYSYNPGNATGGTLLEENAGKLVPAGMVNLDVGESWSKRMAAGEHLQVGLTINITQEERKSWNVIAETVTGDANNVIMLGAHLDSVSFGPGINDNASGSAALMTILDRLCDFRAFRNRVRLAWWGAEEIGLLGSKHYASQLGEEEADRIRFYFNYDMVGAIKPRWNVFSCSEADDIGAKILGEALKNNEKLKSSNDTVRFRPCGDYSDDVAFRNLGIPSSGITSGSVNDCWHKACDDKENVSVDTAYTTTQAASIAMARLADGDLQDLPQRNRTSVRLE